VSSHPLPGFGEADLSNCEREQIHLAGSIQPHGAMLVVREHDLCVIQASANARRLLSHDRELLGRSLSDIAGNIAACVRPHITDSLDTIPTAVRCRAGSPPAPYDCLIHRAPDGAGVVIELEPAGETVDVSGRVNKHLNDILSSTSLQTLCDDMAEVFKELAGYDRVMVYRFDEDGHGQVLSESREPQLDPYLGMRYPASDIPQIARRLYERNRVRMLADVEYTPVPLQPEMSPATGAALDMSHCFLRSMSPIHIQYLKNMGVGATLVVSLVVGGRLWGLVACHHYRRRIIGYELRGVCELLAEAYSTRIAALESFAESQSELAVRRLEQRLVEAIYRDGDWKTALFDKSHSLLKSLNASGAALLFEGEVLTAGEVPGTSQLWRLSAWLDEKPRPVEHYTKALAEEAPEFSDLKAVASGLLATSVSSSPGEYLLWFRKEQVQTVTWGGNPFKPVEVGDNPADLSPRRSFAQWHQLVKGTSEPWTPGDRAAAHLISQSVADVILQFRSVRMLILQEQLDTLSYQVRSSDNPVVIADSTGRILLGNESFERLLGPGRAHLEHINDLQGQLTEPEEARQRLTELLSQQRPWRGEVCLKRGVGPPLPVLVRADPVFSSPGRALGYVVLFNTLSEKKEAETARRRFQNGIVERHRFKTAQLDSASNLLYRNLMSPVLGNAQLAALEITDCVEPAHMPEMLESVQASVNRTAELLEQLIWHANRASKDETGRDGDAS